MQLHVMFQGLCVLVPSQDGTYVDVVIPETAGASHPHKARLESRGHAKERMRDFLLDFSALAPRSTVTYPIATVHDVGGLCSVSVPPEHLRPFDPHRSVVSRIRMPAPDRLVAGQAVAFRVGHDPANVVWLTHEYAFEYDGVMMDDDTFHCHPLRASNPSARPVKRPTAGSGPNTLLITITNFPQHVPDPCPGDRIDHVDYYYQYLNCAGPDVFLVSANPNCREPERNAEAPAEFASAAFTTLAYNCMLGQAPAG